MILRIFHKVIGSKKFHLSFETYKFYTGGHRRFAVNWIVGGKFHQFGVHIKKNHISFT